MNGPTMRRRMEGKARRTSNPSPRSRVRGRITVSIGEAGSRSANGSSDMFQVIATSARQDAAGSAGLLSEHPAREEDPVSTDEKAGAVHVWKKMCAQPLACSGQARSEEHTSELQSRLHLVCRLLLEKKKNTHAQQHYIQLHKI